MEKIRLSPLCEKVSLKALCGDSEDVLYFDKPQVISAGLALTGFKADLKGRAALIGGQEAEYLHSLPESERRGRIELLKHAELVVVSDKGLADCVCSALERFGTKVVLSLKPASVSADLALYIESKLNTVQMIHGVLVDVFGVGALIIGESGIGKSEIALELISRGHLLAADDAVAVRREGNALIGCSPSVIRHLMEVRGIGIIDVRAMYGAGAVKVEQEIDMVVNLADYSDDTDYAAEESYRLSGVSVPLVNLPVRQGRNLAVLIEVAARQFRLKYMGHDAMAELDQRIKKSNRERKKEK
jgi:HPr kinase/phosphorylase